MGNGEDMNENREKLRQESLASVAVDPEKLEYKIETGRDA